MKNKNWNKWKDSKIKILLTSKCNGGCQECSVKPWMKKYGNTYHYSLSDLEYFIDCTQRSDYHFKLMRLTGGEPLLWKHLEEGIKKLKLSGIVDNIWIITNGLMIKESNKSTLLKIADYVNFSISSYYGNEKNIDYAKKLFNINKLNITRGKTRNPTPVEPIPKTLPALCSCKGLTIFGNTINFCSPFITSALNDSKYPHLSKEMNVNYFSFFDDVPDKFNWEFCQKCVGNKKVRNKSETIINRVK